MSLGFTVLMPTSVEEVSEALAANPGQSRILAGGQSLIVLMRQGLVAPGLVIALDKVQELRSLDVDDDARLVAGSMTTYTDIARSPNVREGWPLLAEASSAVGSIHIRNRGTIGGSICHADPAADVPTALIALDATVTTRRDGGNATRKVGDVLVGPFETTLAEDEIVTSIEVPAMPAGSSVGYARFMRRDGEYPLVVAACVLIWRDGRCAEARIAAGGVYGHPQRLSAVEEAVAGTTADRSVIEEVAMIVRDLSEPPVDIRGGVEWRKAIAGTVVVQSLSDAASRAVS